MKIIRNGIARLLPVFLAVTILISGLTIPGKASAQPGASINFQTFYDELSPYGQWLNDPEYGYVWAPSVGNDFRPYYTNGYWMMTEYGNMWMSNYDWGWAPFHYGRWTYSDFYGWIWVPGTEWGPAWVTWRQGGGYYGWAPMSPGISINISFGPRYNVPNPWWTFIPYDNIYSRSFHRYYSPRRTVNIINNTTIINNTYIDNRSRSTYVTGPRRTDVERATGRRVSVYNVGNENRAGAPRISGRNVNIYRPAVETGARGSKPAPRQVKTMERPISGARNAVRPPRDNNATPGNNARERVSNTKVAPRNVDNRAIDNRPATPVQREKVQPAPRNTNSRNVQPRQNIQKTTQPAQQRVQTQQRVEQPQPVQQRIERTPAQQRAVPQQRTQPAQQRVQPQPRVERAHPQRVERVPAQRNTAPARTTPARGR